MSKADLDKLELSAQRWANEDGHTYYLFPPETKREYKSTIPYAMRDDMIGDAEKKAADRVVRPCKVCCARMRPCG